MLAKMVLKVALANTRVKAMIPTERPHEFSTSHDFTEPNSISNFDREFPGILITT